MSKIIGPKISISLVGIYILLILLHKGQCITIYDNSKANRVFLSSSVYIAS